MGVENLGTMQKDIIHLQEDIIEIKTNAKEMNNEILAQRDSHTETKIYIKQIQESQSNMSKESKDNQTAMLKAIQDIKDEPVANFKYYKLVGWGFAITYVLGTIFGVVKAFIK